MGEEVRREKKVDGLGSSHRGGLGCEDIESGRSGSEVVGERAFSSMSMEFGEGDLGGMVVFY